MKQAIYRINNPYLRALLLRATAVYLRHRRGLGAYKFLAVIGAGSASNLVLRWFWWARAPGRAAIPTACSGSIWL
jgi:hypothetical protein